MRQPICLFGEDAGDRRERLRNCIVQHYIEHGQPPQFFHKFVDEETSKKEQAESKEEGVFYTEGTEDLKQARLEIAKFSIPLAQKRLVQARSRRE